jgi:RIP metalloprotease RseP
MVKLVKAAPSTSLAVERVRQSQLERIELKPSNVDGQGRIGAQLQANLSGAIRPVNGLGELVQHTGGQFVRLVGQTASGYAGLITNFKATAGQVSGPVKIVEMGAQLSRQGGSGLVLFMALISINLAVLNALPLPLLDGGQMALLLIEGVRGKPVPERLQLAFAQSGFLLLVGLTVVLVVRDTSQLTFVQQLLGH